MNLSTLQHVDWTTVGTIIGLAGGTSIVTQFGKKLLKLANEKWVQFLFMIISGLAALVQSFLSSKNVPASVFGVHTAAIMGVATPFYFYFLKPVSGFLSRYKLVNTKNAAPVAEAVQSVQQAVDTAAQTTTQAVNDASQPAASESLPQFKA